MEYLNDSIRPRSQRYLRLDEADGQATIKVAEGVCFVATANIGNEHITTRQLDKALMDRFVVIEMDTLSDEEEHGLLTYLYPTVDSDMLGNVAKIAFMTRSESMTETQESQVVSALVLLSRWLVCYSMVSPWKNRLISPYTHSMMLMVG